MPTATELEMLAIYLALAAGLVMARTKRHWFSGLAVLVLLAVVFNARYFVFGVPDSIAFFVSLYDTFLGWNGGPQLYFSSLFGSPLGSATTGTNATNLPGMAPCDPNWPGCSLLGYYTHHPSWASQFYNRFADGLDGADNSGRRRTLRLHILFNTVALLVGFLQVFVFPGTKRPGLHKKLGWLTVACVAIGCSLGMRLGSEHGEIAEYGGQWAVAGWLWMYLLTVVPLALGVRAAVRKEPGWLEAHRIWMARFNGGLWGAFWAFRVHFMWAGPVFIGSPSATSLLAIWSGAPTGILLAEWARHRKGVAPSPFLHAFPFVAEGKKGA